MKRLSRNTSVLLFLVVTASTMAQTALATSKFRVLHDFTNGDDGGNPVRFAPLAMDKNGNVYGAGNGGIHRNCEGWGCGVIFRFSSGPGGKWTETVLYNYNINQYPADSPLAVDAQNNLYGCSGSGPMFELSPAKGQWSLTPIWSYGCDDSVGLVLDVSGNLYGNFGNDVTGGISELSPTSGGWNYTNLYTFCKQQGCPDGTKPLAPLSWDALGNLYGTTYNGGYPGYPKHGCNCGVAFQMTPNGRGTWTYRVMHRFSYGKDGGFPYGSLTVDSRGNAYGTTTYAGPYGNGTVFKLAPIQGGHWKLNVVYGFPDPYKEGAAPGNNLVFDKAGNMYGMAGSVACGGACGLVFKLSSQKNGKWSYSVVHRFSEVDGDFPNGLTMDNQGNLYGTTSGGGKYGYGVLFEITP